jgi:chitin disaccharide deacetylase
MRIITNGDDFGRCADTVKATIECLDAGVLTSASIMAKMPGTRLAVSYAKANPSFSFGVHLTFSGTTVEAPVLSPRNIPALVTHEGRFRQANRLRVMALSNQIPIEQIEAEAVAQISLLMEQGVPVSHVDSHFHLHKFPPSSKRFAALCPSSGSGG